MSSVIWLRKRRLMSQKTGQNLSVVKESEFEDDYDYWKEFEEGA
jgi:hypothetical protein